MIFKQLIMNFKSTNLKSYWKYRQKVFVKEEQKACDECNILWWEIFQENAS